MSILIGLIPTHSSGSYHGAEGFEGFSMDGTVVHVLKEGSTEELTTFAKNAKQEAEDATNQILVINQKMRSSYIPHDDYANLENKRLILRAKTTILKYEKLIIVEGVIL